MMKVASEKKNLSRELSPETKRRVSLVAIIISLLRPIKIIGPNKNSSINFYIHLIFVFFYHKFTRFYEVKST